MYTLKIESVNEEFLRDVQKDAQALIQENKMWSYSLETSIWSTTIELSTMNIRELKRLVDLLESEEFMRDD